jgi:hypothetical protein
MDILHDILDYIQEFHGCFLSGFVSATLECSCSLLDTEHSVAKSSESPRQMPDGALEFAAFEALLVKVNLASRAQDMAWLDAIMTVVLVPHPMIKETGHWST